MTKPRNEYENMKAPKCANCGANMIEAFTKAGLRIFLCPHKRFSLTRKIDGRPKCGEIHCGIDVQGLRASFEELTRGCRVTVEELRAATKQTVSDAELLENANLAIMLGLPPNELGELFEAAFKLGMATGVTPTKAIQALCRGIGRRSRLILDNIGIAFKAHEAYTWYAQKVDKPRVSELTETERTEAWQQYAINLVKEKADTLRTAGANLHRNSVHA